MSPEEIKTLKIILATLKFDIGEIIEEKVRKILNEKLKPRPKVEVGYR